MSSCYIKINGRRFDLEVAIGEYSRNFNVLDGDHAGRVLSGRMVRDVIGTYLGHNVKVYPLGMDTTGTEALWDYLFAHSVDDSVMLEAADGQTTIKYEAYYTSASQKLERVDEDGSNHWGEITINFIPMDATIKRR